MDSDKINRCVEALCQNGCDAVRATISSLEIGLPVHATRDLDAEESAAVLGELKTIMAVYDDRDGDYD
ncbi:MAG: hypothetical protein PVF75_07805 [Granulosicoccaceae bacterium]|jgi:hypothetical protein